jgi:hypothetical protein
MVSALLPSVVKAYLRWNVKSIHKNLPAGVSVPSPAALALPPCLYRLIDYAFRGNAVKFTFRSAAADWGRLGDSHRRTAARFPLNGPGFQRNRSAVRRITSRQAPTRQWAARSASNRHSMAKLNGIAFRRELPLKMPRSRGCFYR